jgi:hypothetical protein
MINYYLNAVTNIVLAVICLGLGAATLGKPFLFELVSILTFLFIAYLFRTNVNIKGLCALLILDNLLINGVYLPYDPTITISDTITLNNFFYVEFMSSKYWLVMSYGLAAVCIYKFWYDSMSKITFGVLVISISAEVYWYVVGYDGPQIHFYFVKIAVYQLIRQLIIYRPHNGYFFTGIEMKKLSIEWFIIKIKSVSISIECLMVIEYLIRHLTPNARPMLLYISYDYFMQFIGSWLIWLVLSEAYKLYKLNTINA